MRRYRSASPLSYKRVLAHNWIVEKLRILPLPIGRLLEWIYLGWLRVFGPRKLSPDRGVMAEIERRRIVAAERALEEFHKLAISDGPAYLEALPNGEYVVFSTGRIHWSSSVLADTFLPLNNS